MFQFTGVGVRELENRTARRLCRGNGIERHQRGGVNPGRRDWTGQRSERCLCCPRLTCLLTPEIETFSGNADFNKVA